MGVSPQFYAFYSDAVGKHHILGVWHFNKEMPRKKAHFSSSVTFRMSGPAPEALSAEVTARQSCPGRSALYFSLVTDAHFSKHTSFG